MLTRFVKSALLKFAFGIGGFWFGFGFAMVNVSVDGVKTKVPVEGVGTKVSVEGVSGRFPSVRDEEESVSVSNGSVIFSTLMNPVSPGTRRVPRLGSTKRALEGVSDEDTRADDVVD